MKMTTGVFCKDLLCNKCGDTSGGDGPEFYELVIKKIVEETEWREGSTRSIL